MESELAGIHFVKTEGDAWRWLGWAAPDASGQLTCRQLEILGHVPEPLPA